MTRLQAVRLAGAGTAVLAAMLFIAVAAATVSGATQSVDAAIRDSVHAWASDATTQLAIVASFVGSAPVWLALTFVATGLFWRLGWWHAATDLAIVMAGAVVLENGLKLLFARLRPEAFFGDLPASHSFPSGHAMFNACLYVTLACLIEARIASRAIGAALWIAAIVIAGAIGLSRIYLGVHYPSDVAAGFLLAASWIGLVTAMRGTDAK